MHVAMLHVNQQPFTTINKFIMLSGMLKFLANWQLAALQHAWKQNYIKDAPQKKWAAPLPPLEISSRVYCFYIQRKQWVGNGLRIVRFPNWVGWGWGTCALLVISFQFLIIWENTDMSQSAMVFSQIVQYLVNIWPRQSAQIYVKGDATDKTTVQKSWIRDAWYKESKCWIWYLASLPWKFGNFSKMRN